MFPATAPLSRTHSNNRSNILFLRKIGIRSAPIRRRSVTFQKYNPRVKPLKPPSEKAIAPTSGRVNPPLLPHVALERALPEGVTPSTALVIARALGANRVLARPLEHPVAAPTPIARAVMSLR